ncbi:MAG: N-acetylmuramoyl-L-alanine amidase [Clostridiaceae bacterium]|jgi:N-acetylmuramoyl-L-alanine amidase|nr:N-acetylmuramoyl-L-alanine amidase [Clostridiaceae bacterium]
MRKVFILLISLVLVVPIALSSYRLNKSLYSNSKDSNKQETVKSESKDIETKTVPQNLEDIKELLESKFDKSKPQKNEIIKNVNVNVPNKVHKIIVIDPGHGNKSNLEKEPIAPNSSEMEIKDGGGAQGVVTKNPEYLINMNVSLKLKQILEQRGYTVKMTKTSNAESLGNVKRAEIWNNEKADLAIRIHADSNDNRSVKGASALVPAPINENTRTIFHRSQECGQVILNTVTKEVGMKNRGVVQTNDMTAFNWSKVPVILIEMGFLSNVEEDRLLSTQEYQNKIAFALAYGISEVLK